MNWEIGKYWLYYTTGFIMLYVGRALRARIQSGKVDGPCGPKVLKVLKFDSGFTAEGCGIATFGGDEYIVRVTGLPSRPRVILSDSEESWYVESLR